jgi:hypothetical protein
MKSSDKLISQMTTSYYARDSGQNSSQLLTSDVYPRAGFALVTPKQFAAVLIHGADPSVVACHIEALHLRLITYHLNVVTFELAVSGRPDVFRWSQENCPKQTERCDPRL